LALAPAVNRAYRLALFCGACPLVVGVSIFLLWLVTRWEWLPQAGILTILGGCVLFLIGSFALLRAHWFAAHDPVVPKSKLWRATLLGAGLLLSNFLVAGGIIFIVVNFALNQPKRIILPDAAAVAKPQTLFFDAAGSQLKKNGAVSGVDFRVQGHIDGAAEITGPLSSLPHKISGDVDWQTSGDYYEFTMTMSYSPTHVTAGQLTFELEFH
jgi:hypothetical protein